MIGWATLAWKVARGTGRCVGPYVDRDYVMATSPGCFPTHRAYYSMVDKANAAPKYASAYQETKYMRAKFISHKPGTGPITVRYV